ncbi:MAG: hypothetical protein R2750_12280 [Bacteroidales bacterium]
MVKKIQKIVIITLIMFSSVQLAKGQVLLSIIFGDNLNTPKLEFGLSGGFNYSYIRGIDGSKGVRDFELGFYFDYMLSTNPHWYLGTGVFVKSNVGGTNIPMNYSGNRVIDSTVYSEFANFGGTITKKFNTFYVPINLRYLSESGIYVDGGVQIGLVFKTIDTYTVEVEDHDLHYDVKYGVKDNGLYKWFDGGVDGGIGYKSKGSMGWKIGVYYYVGLTNIYKNDLGPKAYNSSLYVLANIPIGKKKAEKKRAEKEATDEK